MVGETQEHKVQKNETLQDQTSQNKVEANFLSPQIITDLQKQNIDAKTITDKTNFLCADEKFSKYESSIKELVKNLVSNPNQIPNKKEIVDYFDVVIKETLDKYVTAGRDVSEKLKDINFFNDIILIKVKEEKGKEKLEDRVSGKTEEDIQKSWPKIESKYKAQDFEVKDKLGKVVETVNYNDFFKGETEESIKNAKAVYSFEASLGIDVTDPNAEKNLTPKQSDLINKYKDLRYSNANIVKEAKVSGEITKENKEKIQSYNSINESAGISPEYNLNIPNDIIVISEIKDIPPPTPGDKTFTEISKDPIGSLKSLDKDDSFDKLVDGTANKVDIKSIKLDKNQKADILSRLGKDENYQALSAKMVDKLVSQNENFFMPGLDAAAKENQIQIIKKCFNKDATINEEELAKSGLGEKQKEGLKQISDKVIDNYATNDAYGIQVAKEKFKIQKAVACCVQTFGNYLGNKTDIFNEKNSSDSKDNFANNFTVKEGGIKMEGKTIYIDGGMKGGADVKFAYDMATGQIKASEYLHFNAGKYFIDNAKGKDGTSENGRETIDAKGPRLDGIQKTIATKIDGTELKYDKIDPKNATDYLNKEFSNITLYHEDEFAKQDMERTISKNIAMTNAMQTIKDIIPSKSEYSKESGDGSDKQLYALCDIISTSANHYTDDQLKTFNELIVDFKNNVLNNPKVTEPNNPNKINDDFLTGLFNREETEIDRKGQDKGEIPGNSSYAFFNSMTYGNDPATKGTVREKVIDLDRLKTVLKVVDPQKNVAGPDTVADALKGRPNAIASKYLGDTEASKSRGEAEGLIAGLDNPQQEKKQEATKNPENMQKMV